GVGALVAGPRTALVLERAQVDDGRTLVVLFVLVQLAGDVGQRRVGRARERAGHRRAERKRRRQAGRRRRERRERDLADERLGLAKKGRQRIERPANARPVEDPLGLVVGGVEVDGALQRLRRDVVVAATNQDLAEEREAGLVVAVELDDLDELGLRFLPAMEDGEGAPEEEPRLGVVGVIPEPLVQDVNRLRRTPDVEVTLGQRDEHRRLWVPPKNPEKPIELARLCGVLRRGHSSSHFIIPLWILSVTE